MYNYVLQQIAQKILQSLQVIFTQGRGPWGAGEISFSHEEDQSLSRPKIYKELTRNLLTLFERLPLAALKACPKSSRSRPVATATDSKAHFICAYPGKLLVRPAKAVPARPGSAASRAWPLFCSKNILLHLSLGDWNMSDATLVVFLVDRSNQSLLIDGEGS